ncbi:MAG: glycosyltransferase family 2 protein [Flavobacterium sp.]|nr:glycosyltransferase family 2 protein [Flavobacterium sp.]
MFSVIIPYFNKSKYIQRCLNSVMNQSYQEFEIILVNDGSTDNGLHFISHNYSNKLTLINQENNGVSAARNTGIKAAKYPFIAFLDADDCWHIQYLQKVKDLIDKEENIKIIGAHYSRDKEFLASDSGSLDYFKFANYFKSAIRNTYFTSSSTIINVNFFSENEGFRTNLFKGEDIDVWIRAVQSGGNAFYIKNTLVYYSDEDVNQVTKVKGNIRNSIVGIINQQVYNRSLSINEKDFEKFISIFVLCNLYPYFYNSESHNQAKFTLKNNKYRFFFLNLIYAYPLVFGVEIMKSSRLKEWVRLYIKFVIKYLI